MFVIRSLSVSSSLIIVVLMLFSTARALSSLSTRSVTIYNGLPGMKTAQLRYISATRMFSSATEGDKSIVDTCRDKIKKALETDDVIVKGAFDDPNGSHISVEVVSDLFVGKRALQRQQLVYKAIWDEMQGPVHAVDSMICKTADEK